MNARNPILGTTPKNTQNRPNSPITTETHATKHPLTNRNTANIYNQGTNTNSAGRGSSKHGGKSGKQTNRASNKCRLVRSNMHARFRKECVGELAHIMLPKSATATQEPLPAKFAETAVPALAKAIRKKIKAPFFSQLFLLTALCPRVNST